MSDQLRLGIITNWALNLRLYLNSEEISSEDYIKLRDLNRKTLCLYLDQIKSNEEALKDI